MSAIVPSPHDLSLSKPPIESQLASLKIFGDKFDFSKDLVSKARSVARKLKKSRSLTDERTDEMDKDSLEHDLLTKKEHTLTKSQVVDILIKQNLAKYKKFMFLNR